ncbi:MAG: two component transcriptional regulator [Micavibrio sp.]|nr:two component transcriptional regulator [Micavibrio sp.]
MRVLIVEDDLQVVQFVSKGLNEVGHVTESAASGPDGLQLATSTQYDVAIIDRMLPGLDGLSLLKTLRGTGNAVPVLILSALGQVDDKVEGLRAGGDDYLVKPFAFAELLARVEVLGRRQLQPGASTTKLVAGGLELDLLNRKVIRDRQEIDLQTREFHLLEYLLKHKGRIVTRTMLLEAVWDYHFDPQTNVIDVHISRLRSKVDKGFPKPLIKTVRGAGYIIEE